MSRSFPLISKDKVGVIDASVDRAGRASPQAPSGLDHAATIDLPGHTPGPWSAHCCDAVPTADDDGVRFYDVLAGEVHKSPANIHASGYIACGQGIGHIFGPRERREANARLISAAPDLLDALKALQLQALQSRDLRATEWGQEALDMARAAIAKATGAA